MLSERIKGRYRLIGLSLSSAGVDEYVAQQGMDFPMYTNLSPQSIAAYRLGGTPATIVVSAGMNGRELTWVIQNVRLKSILAFRSQL